MTHRIREWPPSERPRERLLERGAGELSDAELLALVLQTSTLRGRSAIDQARALLASVGDLRALGAATPRELTARSGLGPARAAAIAAALELGRRAVGRPVDRGRGFRTSGDVFGHLRGRLAPLRREVFYVLLLDAKHRRLRDVQVSEGSLTAAIVHPREVFAPAVRDSAAAVILAHNHPSGDPEPSSEDVELTRRLRDAGELIGIRVLDHVIVGAETHFSFADAGYW